MIVAGIGCRRGATEEAVLAAVDAALVQCGLVAEQLGALAVPDEKRSEIGVVAAAQKLSLPLITVSAADLQQAGAHTLSFSARVQNLKGVPSVAEAAALAAAGAGARLVAPRATTPSVACALATGAGP